MAEKTIHCNVLIPTSELQDRTAFGFARHLTEDRRNDLIIKSMTYLKRPMDERTTLLRANVEVYLVEYIVKFQNGDCKYEKVVISTGHRNALPVIDRLYKKLRAIQALEDILEQN